MSRSSTAAAPARANSSTNAAAAAAVSSTIPKAEAIEGCVLTLPFADVIAGSYIEMQTGRIDFKLNRETELPGFQRLHAGLREKNATFKDGRPIDHPADVVRWICEQLTASLPMATAK